MELSRSWVESRVGARVLELEPLAGGAGARRYFRVHLAGGETCVFVRSTLEDDSILPPALKGRDALADFVTATRFLSAHDVPVPRLLGVEPDERWLLLEDLGVRHLCDLAADEAHARRREAVDLLVRVHALSPPPEPPFVREWDREWIRFELSHFEAHALGPGDGPDFARLADALAEYAAALPRALSLRDFQSQNLLVDPRGALRVIDYQDAFRAPRELDIAALLHDSYVSIDRAERRELLERYATSSGVPIEPSAFAAVVVQRKCKDLARYLWVSRDKGDRRYGAFVGRARESLRNALPELPDALSDLAAPLGRALEESHA